MDYLYLFWGKVIRGKNRGKKLGYPTLNLRLHKIMPEGVYVSQAKIGKTWHNSITFAGAARTFEEKEVFAETHIFNFDRDIYRKWVSVRLLKKMRGNIKFASEAELIKQMNRDKEEAFAYFKIRGSEDAPT